MATRAMTRTLRTTAGIRSGPATGLGETSKSFSSQPNFGVIGTIGGFVKDALIGEARDRLGGRPVPGAVQPPQNIVPTSSDCGAGRIRVAGKCVDPLAFPAGGRPFISAQQPTGFADGVPQPTVELREVMVCPTFANGKKGILWMSALTGEVFCLPRGVNGKAFGLIRKNRPRKPAFISAADKKALSVPKALQNKAKKLAQDAGFSCKKK